MSWSCPESQFTKDVHLESLPQILPSKWRAMDTYISYCWSASSSAMILEVSDMKSWSHGSLYAQFFDANASSKPTVHSTADHETCNQLCFEMPSKRSGRKRTGDHIVHIIHQPSSTMCRSCQRTFDKTSCLWLTSKGRHHLLEHLEVFAEPRVACCLEHQSAHSGTGTTNVTRSI